MGSLSSENQIDFQSVLYSIRIHAGLQEGDVITAVNGEAITGSSDLKSKISSSEVGDILSLEVYRNGETIQINVTVGEQNTTSNSSSLEESSSSSSGYRN